MFSFEKTPDLLKRQIKKSSFLLCHCVKINSFLNGNQRQCFEIWIDFYAQYEIREAVFYSYCKVSSSNTSRLEAHTGFFRLLMKGIFDPYDN